MAFVSCSGKFHAFALAEQLNRHNILRGLYTTYAYQKNIHLRSLAKRIDKEIIPKELIYTNTPLAFFIKGIPKEFIWNDLYDRWVAYKLSQRSDYKTFIGWSGMSLHSINQAKKDKKITILERGSSHIEYQNKILQEEYNKFDINFSIDTRVIEKELKEYEAVDFISIPSIFVKNSFLEMGVKESKLILNNYGASSYFKRDPLVERGNKFIILYLGTVSIRKGLIYFFEALHLLNIKKDDYEVWFIGGINDEMKKTISKYNERNWRWKGFVSHYDLPKLISQCSIAIHPSIEEGLSTVIPQILACGVPVIASTNSGGEDIIEEGKSGFIIPIRYPKNIANKIELLFNNSNLLNDMQLYAEKTSNKNITWNNYGNRYATFLNSLA